MILAAWMADTLRAAGVTVVEYPGWAERTRPGQFLPRAILWHHDATAAGPSPNAPRYIAEVGRPPETPAPLAHAWVDTLGRWHLLAAGRANHAGTGDGWGAVPADLGNSYAIGVETDHTTGEQWYPMQLDGLRRGTAALLARMGADPRNALCGHREYAPGRKTDPHGLDMDHERAAVAALMAPPPTTSNPPEDDDMPLSQDDVNRIAAAVWAYTVAGDEDSPPATDSISAGRAVSRAYSQARKARILAGQAAASDGRNPHPPVNVPSESPDLYA